MKFMLQELGYRFNLQTNVWIRPDYLGIAYSDGDEVEQRIFDIIKQASDLSVLSAGLREHCTDWPSLYHLSSIRANVLRPFQDILKGADVLEVGAGCGAITRYLGECGANVLALEGTPRRAAIARSRTRDLPNVIVVSDRFDDFKWDQQFDVITLIGVLEYANLFMPGGDPALAMLQRVRAKLKPNGKLILAIENQLGLKYFAGAPEDHLGQPMYGIEGRYRKDQPQTYGRKSLSEMLRQAGFEYSEFMAPFPDYKLPVSIVTECGFSCEGFDASALAWQSVKRDPQLPSVLAFSPELVWPFLIKSGIGLDFSNSFLVVAGVATNQKTDLSMLAWHFTSERAKEFCKETRFLQTDNGSIEVHYYPLVPGSPSHIHGRLLTFFIPSKAEYVQGRPLSQELIHIVTRDDWHLNDVGVFFKQYFEFLVSYASAQGISTQMSSPESQIPGEYFDVIPQNIIIGHEGKWHIIDQEWALNENMSVGWLLFRALIWLIGSVTRFGICDDAFVISTHLGFIKAVFKTIGFSLTEEQISSYAKLELAVQEEVTGRKQKVDQVLNWWRTASLQRLNLNQTLAERDGQITKLNQAIAERDGQISNLGKAVAERDQSIQALSEMVAQRDVTLAERDGQIASLTGQLSEARETVDSQNQQMAELQQSIVERDTHIANLIAARDHILSSRSWKITKPLRFIRSNFINNPYFLFRKIASDSVRKMWIKLPLSAHRKISLKNNAFKNLPFVFRQTKAYRDWVAMTGHVLETSESIHALLDFDAVEQPRNAYVPLLEEHPPKEIPVRLIAFYLPQFHAIAENDVWWGEGFTEWTNVKTAQPQFEGHYQPRIPEELGYYNLLDPVVQQRQVELAKLYGIGGFCFHFYWFGGKRLLEAPIENYFNDKSLDFPFCLCWANENWTRRWDGLDKDILISQCHSPEDDLAFIKHVARYMRESRYIRIDGKPLLVVYRPALLPSAEDTVKRWRKWCKENGIGEIYLAYTQSFETVDPNKYGFDAAIEFPPNNSAPPNITDTVKPLTDRFGCTVYDWRCLVERSRNYQKPAYKLFRSVCPSWDNTARRKNKGGVFLNSTPRAYQEWLSSAVAETCQRIANPDERLIFVNAWNEWAEGAYLEPDERYGYAYLDATRKALINNKILLNIIDSNHIQKKINKNKKNILHDLFFSRSSFHGGGEYGKAVFKELSNKVSKNNDIELWVVADINEFLDEWIWEICKIQNIKVIPVKNYKSIIDIVNLDLFDVFFAPAIVIYAEGYEYFVKPGYNINFTSRYTKVIGALLDIRDYELAKDYSKIIHNRHQLKCHPEEKLSTFQIDQIINQKKYDAEQLKKMYIEICTCKSIDSIITISEYSKNLIISEIIDCRNKLHVFYAPMKHRASPSRFSINGKHLDFESYALIVNAARIEKNASSAVIAWDEIFSDTTMKTKFSDSFRVIITGINSIEDITTKKLNNYERFICLPFLPAENLEYLYQNTSLLIYISFSEGFGYPPIEVMSYNKPCLVSNITSLPEIYADAVIYCDPYNLDSIKQGIIRAMDFDIPTEIIEKQYNIVTKKQKNDLENLCDLIIEKSNKAENDSRILILNRPNLEQEFL